ncbi:hypothetical protein E1A91_A02G000100v1 [Gossypium mustelinum]|uniref:Uncharacterized protein n=1 Tax=Gossypium mustelinum TaxID=34275 RepID=A0A5D3A3U0_GOSMU|nr:hypothetical protein E1A91_A02G000100v1 [Gossypium mustelinum]
MCVLGQNMGISYANQPFADTDDAIFTYNFLFVLLWSLSSWRPQLVIEFLGEFFLKTFQHFIFDINIRAINLVIELYCN